MLVLLTTGVGSAALIAVGSMALYRRRSLSHLLVTAATSVLLIRALLGVVMLGGYLPEGTHHLLERFLDATAVGLLFTAVYFARSTDPDISGYDKEDVQHD